MSSFKKTGHIYCTKRDIDLCIILDALGLLFPLKYSRKLVVIWKIMAFFPIFFPSCSPHLK